MLSCKKITKNMLVHPINLICWLTLIWQKQSISMPYPFSWLPKGSAHKGLADPPILSYMEISSVCEIYPNHRLAGSRHYIQKVSSFHQKNFPYSFLILRYVIIPPDITGQHAVQPAIPFIISCCFWKCWKIISKF